MHHSQKIRTLLACIDDLTKAVQEMSNDTKLHQADQDLLLYRSRLFYEAVLSMPTESAEALAPAPASTPIAASSSEQEPAHDLQPVEAAIISEMKKAYEAAKTGQQEVEVDLEISVSSDKVPVQAETMVEPEVSADGSEVAQAESPAVEGAEVVQETVEPKAVASPTSTPEVAEYLKQEDVVAAPSSPANAESPLESPAPSPAPAAVAAAPAAKSSMAFSLTGIIERSGDSQLVMAHLKLKPIDDLKSGIGLNEKFLFIRELFENDHLAYAEAIEKLNAAPDLATAEHILAEELLPARRWDLETEAALSFLHLIFRRFAQA
jgi:hypothetical protein